MGRVASIVAVAGCLCLVLFSSSSPAWAQDSSRIAVIDVQRVMRDSTAAVGMRQAIEERRSAYQKEIGSLEESLRGREKELAQRGLNISPDQFGERQREFQTAVTDLGRLVEARKRQINQAMGDAMQQIQAALGKIIEEVVAERDLTLVLPRSQVVFSAEPLEITDVVLDRLNQRMPSVSIALPEE